MTQAQMVRHAADCTGLPETVIRRVMDAIFGVDGAIVRGLGAERRVMIRGFGTFELRSFRSRLAPATPQMPRGARIRVPAQQVVRFRAGASLRGAVEDP